MFTRLFSFAFMFLVGCASLNWKDEINAVPTLKEAVNVSEGSGKLVALYFSKKECETCRAFENSVLANKDMKRPLREHFVFVWVTPEDFGTERDPGYSERKMLYDQAMNRFFEYGSITPELIISCGKNVVAAAEGIYVNKDFLLGVIEKKKCPTQT